MGTRPLSEGHEPAYPDEINCRDIFKLITHYQKIGSAPRTVFNRISSIGMFLANRRHEVDFKFRMVGRRKGGDIPEYVAPEVDIYTTDEFAACDKNKGKDEEYEEYSSP